MRCGWPLKYFYGETQSYVYSCSVPKKIKKSGKYKPEDYIEYTQDYNDDYNDNASFCELIGTFVWRATNDEKYTEKIINVLAKKLNIKDKLRKKPLTDKQYDLEMDKLMKKSMKGNEGIFKKLNIY